MSDRLKIEVTGWDGSNWTIAGPGAGVEGVVLKPRVSQFFDTPVKTLYVPGPFGEEYAGKRVQRREMVFTVQIGGEEMSPDEWSDVDAAWRWAWDYDKESTITVTTYSLNADGKTYTENPYRYLKSRLMEEPKSYGDRDPYLTGDNEVVMTVTSTFPYWRGADRIYTGSTFAISNDGDVPVWPRWTVNPGSYVLPDHSWGNDMYSRAVADANRTVPLPALPAGASIDSDPRVQTIICENGFPAQHLWDGNDLLYPVMPGASGSISVQGGSVQLTLPAWYTRPWSRPVAL